MKFLESLSWTEGTILINYSQHLIMRRIFLKNQRKKMPNVTKANHNAEKDKSGLIIDDDLFKRLKPSGFSIPLLYELPKLHKGHLFLRQIMDINNRTYHAIAKWLLEILLWCELTYIHISSIWR